MVVLAKSNQYFLKNAKKSETKRISAQNRIRPWKTRQSRYERAQFRRRMVN